MATVRMRDIAARVGVSTATVSKVLGGGTGATLFNAETAQRIREVAREMGYVPNRVARSLQAKRTREIGLVLGEGIYNPASASTLNGHLLVGLTDAATAWHLPSVVVYPRQGTNEPDIAPYLDGRVDGLLVRIAQVRDERFLQLFAQTHLPVVALWYRHVPSMMGYVDVDHEGGAYLATNHLIQLGHQRIAFASDPEFHELYEHPHLPARYQGYCRALAEIDVTPLPEWYVTNVSGLLAQMHAPEPVTAAFIFNDILALDLIKDLTTAGVRIPADLSLTSFDDLIGVAELIAGGLTTIHHPVQEMAAEAVRHLLALIAGTPAKECRAILPTQLVVRNSAAPLGVKRLKPRPRVTTG